MQQKFTLISEWHISKTGSPSKHHLIITDILKIIQYRAKGIILLTFIKKIKSLFYFFKELHSSHLGRSYPSRPSLRSQAWPHVILWRQIYIPPTEFCWRKTHTFIQWTIKSLTLPNHQWVIKWNTMFISLHATVKCSANSFTNDTKHPAHAFACSW
jgi:hypothetical protein